MEMPKLQIGSLTAEIPIIQGGMGVGISLSGLASAVAENGGIGVISTVGIGMAEPDFHTNTRAANKRGLNKELKKSREQTDGIIGLNIMVALSDYEDLVDTAVDEDADVLFLGAGLPLRFSKNMPPERIRDVRTQFVPIVSSARAAQIIFKNWSKKFDHVPDGVVVEGPMAGGHLGFRKNQIDDPDYSLEKLVPEVISIIKPFEQQFGKSIPVIAAGGIFTGMDIHKYLEIGARGVQMGTRFVATDECDADIKFKEAFVNARINDLMIIESPVGLPGRAIRNAFLKDVESGIKKPFKCPWKCLKTCNFIDAPYCIADALLQAKVGELKNGFPFAGANAYRVKEIIPVKELMLNLQKEYDSLTEVHRKVA